MGLFLRRLGGAGMLINVSGLIAVAVDVLLCKLPFAWSEVAECWHLILTTFRLNR